MASSEVYKVVLSGGAPWGFRLQGGSEFRAPLRIAKITPGSKAQKANIYEGLYVRGINDYPSDKLTHGDALNIVKKTGDELELHLCWKPSESSSQPSTTGGSYTTEDIKTTHVSKATFKPSSEAPPYATLPRGGQAFRDVDENFNTTYVSEDFHPPPEVHRGFEKPQPVGRGGRRFDDPSSDQSYGIKPLLTSSSIGSDEDFNMANGDASSQDSGPQHGSARPAMNQFRKQKVNAEIEAAREPKSLPQKVPPPPPPTKPERRYPNIMEQKKYGGPSRPQIKRGGKWYKEMFKEMHSTAGDSDEGKPRFSGLHPAVHANRPPDYVSPLSRTAADRPLVKAVPTTVTVQQEERSKPPTATSLYESRFRSGAAPAQERNRSASEELGVKHQPPSDDDLIKKREEEARQRREEEERRRREEERELMRQQQEEKERREREAEMRRRKQEAEAAAKKAADRPQFFAMALYNFVGQTSKELSFKKGDYIIVKKQIDRNWIEGEVNGKVGIFPTNYVELRPIDDGEESQEESPPSSPYVPVEGEARVKYNFKGESAREMSVNKNEVVTLTRKVDQNWYEGISQGRKGIIPAAYLEVYREPGVAPKGNVSPKATEQPMRRQEIVHQEQVRPVQSQPVSQSPQHLTEIRKTTTTTTYDQSSEHPRSYGEPIRIPAQGRSPSTQAQVQYISKEPEPTVLPVPVEEDQEVFHMEGERYKATYSYIPQNDDELPLEEGEEVIVLEKCDDGWFVGHSTRTGLFGTFPGNYVTVL